MTTYREELQRRHAHLKRNVEPGGRVISFVEAKARRDRDQWRGRFVRVKAAERMGIESRRAVELVEEAEREARMRKERRESIEKGVAAAAFLTGAATVVALIFLGGRAVARWLL